MNKTEYLIKLKNSIMANLNLSTDDDDDINLMSTIHECKTVGAVVEALADNAADAPSIMFDLLAPIIDDIEWTDFADAPMHYDT